MLTPTPPKANQPLAVVPLADAIPATVAAVVRAKDAALTAVATRATVAALARPEADRKYLSFRVQLRITQERPSFNTNTPLCSCLDVTAVSAVEAVEAVEAVARAANAANAAPKLVVTSDGRFGSLIRLVESQPLYTPLLI